MVPPKNSETLPKPKKVQKISQKWLEKKLQKGKKEAKHLVRFFAKCLTTFTYLSDLFVSFSNLFLEHMYIFWPL